VSQEAAVKYFLLGAFASAFTLFGIALRQAPPPRPAPGEAASFRLPTASTRPSVPAVRIRSAEWGH
ncbi:hypothetical protein AB0F45_35110, partial [Streptomyces achromogenes]|uniref:hypothetical protein n=1 Tax=Streptomyces achromogenes TaxID=67255 RepID=UPI0033C2835E